MILRWMGEGKNQRASYLTLEPGFLPRWGKQKRLRCVKVIDGGGGGGSNGNGSALDISAGREHITSRVDDRMIKLDKESPFSSSPPLHHPTSPLSGSWNIWRAKAGVDHRCRRRMSAAQWRRGTKTMRTAVEAGRWMEKAATVVEEEEEEEEAVAVVGRSKEVEDLRDMRPKRWSSSCRKPS